MERGGKGKRALVAGTLAVDVIPGFPESVRTREDLLTEGKNIYLGDLHMQLGGMVANTGVAMHRLGARAVLASRVGDNPFGRAAADMLRDQVPGTVCHITPSRDHDTSATIVINIPGGDRIFWHRQGASQYYRFEDLPRDAVAQADLFHFGYPTGMPCMLEGDHLAELYRCCKKAGLTTSMDTSLPALDSAAGQADWRKILSRTLPYVDIFLPSVEEALFMLWPQAYKELLERAGDRNKLDFLDLSVLDRLAAEVLEMGPGICGIKLGKFGMYLRTGPKASAGNGGRCNRDLDDIWNNRELLSPAVAVEPIYSVNGAGDTAIAGFLTGLLEGMPPEACLQLAMGAAAARIGSPRGAGGIPPAKDILEQAGLWQHEPIPGLPPRYRWQGELGLYRGAGDRR